MRHVWIFQLGSEPSAAVTAQLLADLNAFVAVWKAHGTPVPGSVDIRHGRFVIIQAEPGHASGCSIDSMTKGVTEILQKAGLEVLGPERVFFKDAAGAVAHIDFKEAKAALLDGRMNAETTVFDSTLGNSNELSRWEVPSHQTWLARFIPLKA